MQFLNILANPNLRETQNFFENPLGQSQCADYRRWPSQVDCGTGRQAGTA
jgi:hypothetical protein